jgi:hypothetical protein
MPKLSTALCNAILDSGLGTQFDGGSAILEGRTGSPVADADTAPTGTVVVSVAIPSDAFAAAAARVLAKAGTWQDAGADSAGTIGYWRMRLSGDLGTTNTTDKRMDFTVAELVPDNATLTLGQQLVVNTLNITHPKT